MCAASHAQVLYLKSMDVLLMGALLLQLESVGELVLEVGAPSSWGVSIDNEEKLDSAIEQLSKSAEAHSADLTVLRKRATDAAGHEDEGVVQCHVADVLIRQRSGIRQPLEVWLTNICFHQEG